MQHSMNNKANRTRGRVCTYIKTFFIYIFHLLKHILFILFLLILYRLKVSCWLRTPRAPKEDVLRPQHDNIQHDNTTTHERRTHTPCRFILNKVLAKIVVKIFGGTIQERFIKTKTNNKKGNKDWKHVR